MNGASGCVAARTASRNPARWFAPCLAVLVLVLPVQAEAAGGAREQTRPTPVLSQPVYQQLMKAQELADGGDVAAALRQLDKLRDSRRAGGLSAYEKANLYNMYAYLYYQREQYGRATQAYETVLKQPDLPLAMEVSSQYALAQLYFVAEQYSSAVSALRRWFALVENPQPAAHALLAQMYYQKRDYSAALQQVERAVQLARQKGVAPQESWYLLMRALYYDRGELKKVVRVLEQLLRGWPRKEYLVQLSGMQGELQRERRQLVAMETAYTAGMLTSEQDLLNMAYLYLATDTPYRAAGVLQRGLDRGRIGKTSKNYALLGTALQTAQEIDRAIPAMVSAAELADDGEIWATLATLYLDADDSARAASAARSALERGGLRRPDSTRLVWGMALFNLDEFDQARRQFERAARDKRSRSVAEEWLVYLESEQARRAALAI